jgi:hypothetical protein
MRGFAASSPAHRTVSGLKESIVALYRYASNPGFPDANPRKTDQGFDAKRLAGVGVLVDVAEDIKQVRSSVAGVGV